MVRKHLITYLFLNWGPESNLELGNRTLGKTLSQKKSREKMFDEKFLAQLVFVHLAVKMGCIQ